MAENIYLSQQSPSQLSLNIKDVLDVIQDQEERDLLEMFGGAPSETNYTAVSSMSQMETSEDPKKHAYVQITEQPQPKALRFRYICEGRSAGSIPGVCSTSDNKTYPSLKICNYKGPAFVVVSLVTAEAPYRPHPHNLVGKSCKNGICTMKITNDSMECMFSNLGIQCVKRKEVEHALDLRKDQRVDPFRTGFAHQNQLQGIDLNSVRLCFQVFLEGREKGKFTYPLQPVVSDTIYDKKATSDLNICKLSDCSSTVCGGKEIILLCDKVTKEDIQVKFFEIKDDRISWEAVGDFQAADVHKQVAISFKTPKYKDLEIQNPVKVFVQLVRPSDQSKSDPRPFEYVPMDSVPDYVKRKMAKYGNATNERSIARFFNDFPNMKVSPGLGREPSGGAVPRPVCVPTRSSRLSDKVKIEPQELGLSPPPDISGAVGIKAPISPQHNVGGIVYEMPTSLPPPMTLPSYMPLPQPLFQLPSGDARNLPTVPMIRHPILVPVLPDGSSIIFEDSISVNLDVGQPYSDPSPPLSDSMMNPTDRDPREPMQQQQQPPFCNMDGQKHQIDHNMDDLGGIKSSELLTMGSAAEAMLENFSNSLSFSDTVPPSFNQLYCRNDLDSRSVAGVFAPNIPINVFQKVDDPPVPSSDSLKNLKSDLEMLNNLSENRKK